MEGTRFIGPWTLTWGIVDDYDNWGYKHSYTVLEARNAYGQLYYFHKAVTLDQAREYVNNLPADFNASANDDFVFGRNTYGSDAYQDNWAEEEYSRMGDDEKAGR